MRRLIWIFAGLTSFFVGFGVHRFIETKTRCRCYETVCMVSEWRLRIIPILLFCWQYRHCTSMSITNSFRMIISPLRLHSASSVQIPRSIISFRTLVSSVTITPLKLFSAASINFKGAGNTNMFNNANVQIRSKGVECILVLLSSMLRS